MLRVSAGSAAALIYTPDLNFHGVDGATVQLMAGATRSEPFEINMTVRSMTRQYHNVRMAVSNSGGSFTTNAS